MRIELPVLGILSANSFVFQIFHFSPDQDLRTGAVEASIWIQLPLLIVLSNWSFSMAKLIKIISFIIAAAENVKLKRKACWQKVNSHFNQIILFGLF